MFKALAINADRLYTTRRKLIMPNTMSAKKALRQSKNKRAHNLMWKKRIKRSVKNIKKHLSEKGATADIIKKEEALLYKVVDKAAKSNVIHKNKANRIKSKVSQQITAHAKKSTTQSKSTKDKS